MKKIQFVFRLVALLAITMPSLSYADRADKMEVGFFVPYVNGQDIDFNGGASADLNSDPGFGFTYAYNFSEKLAARMDISMNSISYDAVRVLDNDVRSTDGFSGSLDTFSARVGGDYYFIAGDISPYVNLNIGWNFVDSGVASGPPEAFCWWDPWLGYICDYYQPSYSEDNFMYGGALGVRYDISERHFLRLGYHIDFIDLDAASDTVDLDSFRFEFGFAY